MEGGERKSAGLVLHPKKGLPGGWMINNHWGNGEQMLGSVSGGCGREREGCFVPSPLLAWLS